MCEQHYHGVVKGALGWACWKMYVGRPETDSARNFAMTQLGNGLQSTGQMEDAMNVYESQLTLMQRASAPEEHMLVVNAPRPRDALGELV